MDTRKRASLWALFLSFAKVGVMTFGGGYAMLPLLQREIVDKQKWATDEELADYFAIGQCTPGIIAVNTSTFIGFKERGILGGIVATAGMVTPSFLIIVALASILTQYADNIYVQKAFNGIRVCVCVLIFNAIWKLKNSSIKGWLTFIIYLAVTLISLFLKVSPMIIVLADIAFALILQICFLNRKEAKA